MFLALERKNLDRSKLQIEKVHGNIGLRNSHYFDTRPRIRVPPRPISSRKGGFHLKWKSYSNILFVADTPITSTNRAFFPRIMNETATLPTASPKISYYYFAISMIYYWIQIQIFPRINSEFASSSPVGAAESSSSN